MCNLSIKVNFQLPGWTLLWAGMHRNDSAGEDLRELYEGVVRRARMERDIETLSKDPVVSELRRLFRVAGCDPSRYRPSSEALLRRVLKGDELPTIQPFVDFNNCLSLELAVPCCVMSVGSFSSPLVFRAGTEDESFESLRGPYRLAGKPVLADDAGPCDTPITGSMRVKVLPETKHAWLVAYLPSAALKANSAAETLHALLADVKTIEIGDTFYSEA